MISGVLLHYGLLEALAVFAPLESLVKHLQVICEPVAVSGCNYEAETLAKLLFEVYVRFIRVIDINMFGKLDIGE